MLLDIGATGYREDAKGSRIESSTTNQIIAEFTSMKALEELAYELYSNISSGRKIADEKIRKAVSEIAAAEKRHVELVQEIIDIAHSGLASG